jgi:hypothetical protein
MTLLNKRILVAVSVVLGLVCIAFFFLVKNANEILKSQLTKSLGKDFHIERIVLNWGSIDAYGVRLLRNGEEIAGSEKMNIRADFLGFFKRHYSLSSITLEKPYIGITVDRQGELIVPFIGDIRNTEGAGENKKNTAFKISKLNVNNGRIFFQDERLPATQNSISLKELNVAFEGLTYPFDSSPSNVRISALAEGRILSGRAGAEGKVNLKTGSLDIHFDGRALVLLDLDKRGPIFSAEGLSLSVASREDRNGQYYFVDNVVLKKPYLRYETDNDGELVSPWKEVMEELRKAITKPAARDLK